MIIEKYHAMRQFVIPIADHSEERSDYRHKTDAMGNAMLVTQGLLDDAKLSPGDKLTIDVRILIEHDDHRPL